MLAPSATDLQVPTAAVQGWIDGTLANNGLQLTTNTSPTPDVAYGFATNETANSAHRPSLEFTWTLPAPPEDDEAPDSPVGAHVAASDFAERTADVYFEWPEDNAPSGVEPSGIDVVQYRIALDHGTFSSWTDAETDNFTVEDVVEGDHVEVELRARDNAGNYSTVYAKDFETFSDDDVEEENIEAMAVEFSDRYDVSAEEAENWLTVQARVVEGLHTLEGSATEALIAGVHLDNETRRAHVMVTSLTAQTAIEDILGHLEILDYVDIDLVDTTRDELQQALVAVKADVNDLIGEGKVFPLIPSDLDGLQVLASSTITPAEQGRVTDALDDTDAEYAILPAGSPSVGLANVAPTSGTCGMFTHERPVNEPTVGNAWPYWAQETFDLLTLNCSGTIRGGVAIVFNEEDEDIPSANSPACTSAFTAVGGQSANSPYMMTAGHCIVDADRLSEPVGPDGLRPWQRIHGYQLSDPGDDPEFSESAQELGKVADEVRYNGWYDLPAPAPDNDYSDAGAIRLNDDTLDPHLIGPWFYRYDTRRRLSRVRGVAGVSENDRGVVTGQWACLQGSRTGKISSVGGRRANCGPVLDVIGETYAPGAVPDPNSLTHRLTFGICSMRPGDSGAAVTDSANRAVGINSGWTWERVADLDPTYDAIEEATGQELPHCPDGRRGFVLVQPADEASRDLGMRILTTRWRNPVDTQIQTTDVARATASWNRRVDVDLHVFDEQGNHVSRSEADDIPDAALLANANRGFGPEEFVERANAGRKYTVGVCYFAGEGRTKVDIELRNPDATSRTVTVNLDEPGDSTIVGSTPEGSNVAGIPSDFCDQSGAGGDGRATNWNLKCLPRQDNNWCIRS